MTRPRRSIRRGRHPTDGGNGIDLRAMAPMAIVAFVIASSAAFLVASGLPSTYEARAWLSEATPERALGPDDSEAATARRRLELYARMAESSAISERVIARLGLDDSPTALAKRVDASVSSDGTALEIAVVEGDASLAATLSNTFAEEVVLAASADVDASASLASVIDQELEARLEIMETLVGRIERINDDDELNQRQQRRLRRLERSLQAAPGSYARLVPHSSEGDIGALTIVDHALTPSNPVSPIPLVDALLGGFIGVILVMPLAFSPHLLDRTIANAEGLRGQVPVLAFVPRVPGDWRAPSSWQRPMVVAPESSAADAYRRASIGLQTSSPGPQRRVILIAAPRRGAAKSATAANLALATAQAGRKVVLVDADLDRPNAHRMLGIENGPGLADALAGDVADPTKLLVEGPFGLHVLSAGKVRPGGEHIGTAGMREILAKLSSDHDVIVDSPPLRDSAAGEILGPAADGVILAVGAGRSRRSEVTDALSALSWVGVSVVGAVIVALPPRIIGSRFEWLPRFGERGTSSTTRAPSWPRPEVPALRASGQSVARYDAGSLVAQAGSDRTGAPVSLAGGSTPGPYYIPPTPAGPPGGRQTPGGSSRARRRAHDRRT